jgi:hypothetical protein
MSMKTIQGWPRKFLAIDERAWFINQSQTKLGQACIFLLAAAALSQFMDTWEAVLSVLVAMLAALLPSFRNSILLIGTWFFLFLDTLLSHNSVLENLGLISMQTTTVSTPPVFFVIASLILVFVMAIIGLKVVSKNRQCFLARHPLIFMLILECLLYLLTTLNVTYGDSIVFLWSLILVVMPYVWWYTFAVIDMRSKNASPLIFQMAAQNPFWSASFIPVGKGATFLRKFLSNSKQEMAVTHLKAIKILLWATIFYQLRKLLVPVIEGTLNIPQVGDTLDAYALGHPFPILIGWSSQIWATAQYMLITVAWYGFWVGLVRLAGYRIPRGCWRPLEARTMMEYFNRFSYYFKELLVDFFFIPTFFFIFKAHPRLRMFFATFMAAGVGNALWHFMRDFYLVATTGFVGAIESYTSYIFYCVVLGTAIGISQLRTSAGYKPPNSFFGQVYSRFFLWFFIVCIHMFGDESRDHSLLLRLSYLISLFGV